MSIEDLSREQLLEWIDDFLAHDQREQDLDAQGREETRLVAELQLCQAALEIQNRELRHAPVELEVARDRYSELFDLAPIAYLALDDAGRIVTANRHAAALLRCDARALLGRSLLELSGSSRELATLFARSTQEERQVAAELPFVLGHDVLDVEAIVSCSQDEQDRSVFRCALLDITARKRAERERDRALVSERSLLACFQALDRIHVAVNRMLSSAKPVRADELVDLFAEAILTLVAGEQVIVSLDGTEFRHPRALPTPASTTSVEVPIALGGRPLGRLRVTLSDRAEGLRGQTVVDYGKTLELIADRLALALELLRLHDAEAAERRQLLWLDRARHILAACNDPDEVMHAIAECCAAASGTLTADSAACLWENDELEWLHAPRRFAPVLRQWLAKANPSARMSLDQESSSRMATILRALDSQSVLIVPLRARQRTLGHLCFTLRAGGRADLTRTLEELAYMAASSLDTAQLMRELRGAVDARDTLLALVAHDLRSPLNAISLTASSLSEPPPHMERRRTAPQFQLIQRSIQRMSHLIEDLLTAANIDSGAFAINERPLPAGELALEACALNMPAAQAKRIALRVDCPPGLGDVCADRERVLQVLTNLIVNALKFSPQGSSIDLEVTKQGEAVRYCVRDRGMGMSAEQCAQAFRRYWRGKGTRAGLGLGLFIAERIVNAHRGRIWVESTPGAGACFYFTLPSMDVRRPRAASPQAEVHG